MTINALRVPGKRRVLASVAHQRDNWIRGNSGGNDLMIESLLQLTLRVEGDDLDVAQFATFLGTLTTQSNEIITAELTRDGPKNRARLVIKSVHQGSVVALLGLVLAHAVAFEETRTALVSLVQRLVAAGRTLLGIEDAARGKDVHAEDVVLAAARMIERGGAVRIEFHIHGDNANYFSMGREEAQQIAALSGPASLQSVSDDGLYESPRGPRTDIQLRRCATHGWDAYVDGVWVPTTNGESFPAGKRIGARFATGVVVYRDNAPGNPYQFRIIRLFQ